MRNLLLSTLALFTFTMASHSQTTFDIEAGGGPGGPTPYYEPQFLTIEVGDIVRWTNSGGTHNVDGTLETFPSNPEGFTNGNPSNALWEFEHTFTIPGFYEFECAAFDHADTQFGSITVVDGTTGLVEERELSFELFPNPVAERLNISAEEPISSLRIMDSEMKELINVEVSTNSLTESFDLEHLASGTYFVEVAFGESRIYRRFIKK